MPHLAMPLVLRNPVDRAHLDTADAGALRVCRRGPVLSSHGELFSRLNAALITQRWGTPRCGVNSVLHRISTLSYYRHKVGGIAWLRRGGWGRRGPPRRLPAR